MAENTPNYHTHISSKHRWLDLNLKEVWRYRDLILLFTKRNFVVSYKQTILGPAWIFLTPLFSSIVQAFVFGGIADAAGPGRTNGVVTVRVDEVGHDLGKAVRAFQRAGTRIHVARVGRRAF